MGVCVCEGVGGCIIAPACLQSPHAYLPYFNIQAAATTYVQSR